MDQPVFSALLITRWLFFLVVLAGLYILNDFLLPVLTALIIGLASWPIYSKVVYYLHGKTTLAASLAILLVVLLLIIPMTLALSYAIQEASIFIDWALDANQNGVLVPKWIASLPLFGERLSEYWQIYLGRPHALVSIIQFISGEYLGNIYRIILSTTGNLFHLLFTVLFMLITLFFIYKDGAKMIHQLDKLGEKILQERWKNFSRVIPATISATVTGMGVIAIGEGVVLGIAYWILHVPSPVLLGVVTGFMAMVPGGAPLAFTLVSLYLIGSDNTVSGLSLFSWGSIELFIVDKTLRPRLIGGPVHLPFLPTFFGLMGGIKTMGIVGLFVGPVLMALLFAMWREWIKNI